MIYSENGRFGRRSRAAGILAAALSLSAIAAAAHATTVTDGSGILGSFVGDPNNPNSPDLNAVSATATFDATNIYLSATMAGAIGLTSQLSGGQNSGVYVWGVDRGHGEPFLHDAVDGGLGTNLTPPIGGGVAFDTFIVLGGLADGVGSGSVFLVNFDNAGDAFTVSSQALPTGSVTYSGDTINLVLPESFVPSQGANLANYGYNIWPRLNGLAGNNLVASFMPENSDFNASAVPEPASWALMIGGFGLAGAALRRRARNAALA